MGIDRYLTPQEVADYLRVKKSTIYGWSHEGTIPAHKVGNLIRFRKDEIDRWVMSGKVGRKRRRRMRRQ